MSSMIQRVEYEGYLAADPRGSFTGGGKAISNFSIGSSRQFKNSAGEKVKQTTWLKVSVFGALAEICNQYLEKGSHVIVEGTLRGNEDGHPNVFTRQDGTSGASFEIVATSVRILEGRVGAAKEETADDDNPGY